MGCELTGERGQQSVSRTRASVPPRQGALGAGLAEPAARGIISRDKVTGVAYERAEDGKHVVGLYNRGRRIGQLLMEVGEKTEVDGVKIELKAPGVVSMRNIS